MIHESALHVETLGVQSANPGLRKSQAASDLLERGVVKVVVFDQATVVLRKLGKGFFELPVCIALD